MLQAPLVQVATATNPFDAARVDAWVEEGKTVEEIILEQGISLDGAYGVRVTIGGELVPEKMLSRVRPKGNSLMVVRVVPRGGDSGKFILSIIIGILTIWAGGVALLAATGPMAALQAGALVVGGLMAVAGGIQSLVAPPPTVPFAGDIPKSQDSAALTGTKNTARLYSPIRTVLGQYRVYPDLLAKPFTERVGKDSVLRLLMCFGYGPLDITDIRIGEKTIEELIPSSKYNILQGWDDDPALSIFRDDVEMDVSLQPELPRIYRSIIDTIPDPSEIMTTKADPEEISIDLQFPAGLIAFSDDGTPVWVSVTFTIKERKQGTSTFNPISTPTHGLDEDSGFVQDSAGQFTLKLAERGTVTRGLRWPAASYASGSVHEIEITRTATTVSPDFVNTTAGGSEENRVFSNATVLVIRTIKPHKDSLIPNLAKIELEINADETGLSGVVDNLSAICTSILPKWDNSTKLWGPTHAESSAYNVTMHPSRNAAWQYAQVLRGPANSRQVADERIDGPALLTWAANLDGTSGSDDLAISGTQNVARNLDAVVDYTSTTRKILTDIAGASRASLSIADGKYSVVQDVPQSAIIQHFSPRNSSGFSGAKGFRKKPHALRVHFVNPDPKPGTMKSYQRDERIVYNDGYSLNGNEIHSWEFNGSTEGWTGHQVSNSSASSYLITSTTHSSGRLWSPSSLDFDGSKYNKIRVSLRKDSIHASATWNGRLYWQTTTHEGIPEPDGSAESTSEFVGDRCVHPVPVEPTWSSAGSYVELEYDLSPTSSVWNGSYGAIKEKRWRTRTISRLRFDLFTSTPSEAPMVNTMHVGRVGISDGTKPATAFADLSLWGVSDAEQAYRDARYHMASNKLRPEVFSITVDVEHIVCNRGDRVKVSHDVIGVGYGGARIKSVTNTGGAFDFATMDEEFHFAPGKDYACRIRTQDGNDLLVNVENQGGTSSSLVAKAATSYGTNAAPEEGDLLLFGEQGTESLDCIVLRISPRNDLTALLELTEYNAAVYDPGPIPDHVSNITLQNQPSLLRPIAPEIIGSPVSDENALAFSASGTPQAMIIVNVATPLHAEGTYSPTTHFHGQFRMKADGVAVTDWFNSPRIEATGDTRITLGPVEEGQTYDIRVRAISDSSATSSDWVQNSNHVVVGMSTPPDPPTDLSIWGDAIRWSYDTKPNDFAGFIVKTQPGTDATWATGILLGTNLVTENWVQIGGRIPPGTTTIMVRAVDLSGNESTTLSAVKAVRGLGDYPLLSEQVWTNIWAGAKTDCTHNVSSTFLEADVDSSDLFWDKGPTATYWVSGSADFWGLTTYKTMTYLDVATVYDDVYDGAWPANDRMPGRIRLDGLEIEGLQHTIEYRHYLTSYWVGFVLNFTWSDWKPWPGSRELEEMEQPFLSAGVEQNYEYYQVRIVVQGGATQGKIKSGRIVTEAIPKILRVANQSISSSGTQISLTGLKWRGVTNVSVTPTTTGTAQGALFGEAYDVEDAQTTTAPYEMNGPTVILYNSAGTATAGTASVVVEGY